MLLGLGLMAAAISGGALVALACRRPPGGYAAAWPAYGWCGLAAFGLLEFALFTHASFWVATFFTALIWTAYILIVDAALYRLRGDSPLHHPAAFAALALLSIIGWLVFEAYNLRLHNWRYVGLPHAFALFALGATWAFATITPGILTTAALIEAALPRLGRCRPRCLGRLGHGVMIAAGAALLLLPLGAPAAWAPYLFAAIWAGFIFLLDPINHCLGWPALLGDWAAGSLGRFYSLLLAGAACGFFWEFWNYWAQARWQYIFPILLRDRIFAMPAPGFIGFPPFAIECYTMVVFLGYALLPAGLRGAGFFPAPRPPREPC